MSEPGERRRRREMERASQDGDQGPVGPAASPPSGDGPATPSSRRAMRSRLVTPPAGTSPAAPTGTPAWSAGPAQPSRPAPGGPPAPQVPSAGDTSRSRRSYRDPSLDPTSAPRPATAGRPDAPAWQT
ncbi:hypothetical protein LJN57_011275, partial [Cellulomonas sp. zg-Y766]|nr:hypothetical protein [Cellulomonas wangsupingiae]